MSADCWLVPRACAAGCFLVQLALVFWSCPYHCCLETTASVHEMVVYFLDVVFGVRELVRERSAFFAKLSAPIRSGQQHPQPPTINSVAG